MRVTVGAPMVTLPPGMLALIPVGSTERDMEPEPVATEVVVVVVGTGGTGYGVVEVVVVLGLGVKPVPPLEVRDVLVAEPDRDFVVEVLVPVYVGVGVEVDVVDQGHGQPQPKPPSPFSSFPSPLFPNWRFCQLGGSSESSSNFRITPHCVGCSASPSSETTGAVAPKPLRLFSPARDVYGVGLHT